ncbi:quaternary ammonium compound efflux SMR transporter SugE [Dactylosporangium fulvum]|uniref:Multidrug efflux SMR transporter n=1 Tax=Dactylosporangium fulvum TaxID=53359 RepID=A0ABY5VQF0_9ACTN|nr:multidrug efflux SMR transporter [Dactylosporangium fulvum]UWP79998.1 multidrug efflux SMR transporter [Dactylosporangium fulvum]
MNWLILIAAGVVEVVWSQSIKPTQGFTRPGPTVVCALLGVASVYLLSRAMQGLPVGVSYAVFTGIGAVGAITLGVLVHGDRLAVGRSIALALILGGVVLAALTTPSSSA